MIRPHINLLSQQLIYMSKKEPYVLIKSPIKTKKYRMIMPSEGHNHDFGAIRKNGTPYRDYTLLNDKDSEFYEPDESKRKQIRASYRARHRGDKGLGSRHSPAELSWSILWSKPTLRESIKFYENKFKVKVINKT